MNPTNQGAGEGVENLPQIIRQDKERKHRIAPQNQFRESDWKEGLGEDPSII
jgi:hypothetical protein